MRQNKRPDGTRQPSHNMRQGQVCYNLFYKAIAFTFVNDHILHDPKKMTDERTYIIPQAGPDDGSQNRSSDIRRPEKVIADEMSDIE